MIMKVLQSAKGFMQTWTDLKGYHGELSALGGLLLLAAALESFGLSLIPAAMTAVMDKENSEFIPEFLKPYFDSITQKETAVYLTIAIAILILFKYVLAFVNTIYSSIIIRRMYNQWRRKIFNHYMHEPMNEIQAEKSGILIENMVNQPMRAATFVRFYIGISTNVILVIAMLVALFQASIKITLIFGGFFGAFALLGSIPVKRISSRLGHKEVKLLQNVTSIASEAVNGMQQIRIFGQEDQWRDQYFHCSVEHSKNVTNSAIVSEAPNVIGAFALVAVICSAILYSLDDMAKGLPLAALFVLVGQRIHTGVTTLMRNYSKLRTFKPSFDLVLGLSNTQHHENSGKEELKERLHTIRIENLNFTYPRKPPVFADFSTTIQAGKITALQGASGTGKSTLVSLICGLAKADSGTIYLNDIAINDLDPKLWLQNIGLVSQDNFLFNDTIRNNLALSRTDVDSDCIIDAAMRAGIHDYILSLPDGYDTIVGERGVSLSGGQVQRLAIARALVRDGDLMIFDEATSALDHENQTQILRIMRDLADAGKTVLVISHRPEALSSVDESVILTSCNS